MKSRPRGSLEKSESSIEKEPGRQVRRQRSEQHNRRHPRGAEEETRRSRGATARIREWDSEDEWDDNEDVEDDEVWEDEDDEEDRR